MTVAEATREALVIVPTYNELATIGEVVARLFRATGDRADLLIVDDGSPDGTAGLVASMAAEEPGLHLIERPSKLGLGSAYLLGFRWAMEHGYSYLVEMDGDLSHDPADVPKLLTALSNGADLAIGSRYVPGGGVRNWGIVRRALSRGGNLYVRALLRIHVRDATAGFRAYRVETLRREDLGRVDSNGYAFQIEMTRRIWLAGGRIVELPIVFTERAAGNSKMTPGIVFEAFVSVARWGLARRRRSR